MRIIFIGTAELGVPALQQLAENKDHSVVAVITQPDRPVGRQQKLTPSPIKNAAIQLHIKVFQPENINQKTVIEQIQYLRPDVMIVAAYGQILSKAILQLPKYGCLNIHTSILPKYRGAAPIQEAIRQGDKETGVTIMWMDEGLDTGDILLIDKIKIRSTDNAATLHDKLAELSANSIQKALTLIATQKAPRVKQDVTQASYVKKLRKEDGLIDWTKTQFEIEHHIRAMTPWPSAYSWIPEEKDQKMLKIFTVIISRRAKGKPGEVLRVDKHGILVAAGKGGLLLREVQLEGKKRMHAAEFARGYNLPVGTLLK